MGNRLNTADGAGHTVTVGPHAKASASSRATVARVPRLHITVLDDVDALRSVRQSWDDLAVRTRAPYLSPTWCLAWWRHAAPPGARLRVIVLRSGDEVTAIAPLYCTVERGVVRYRFLGAGTFPRSQPLALPGTEPAAAAGFVAALRDVRPRPRIIEFDGVEQRSPWLRLFGRHWPGARIVTTQSMPAPSATLGDDLDDWLADKSRNFRKQTRRHRRRLDEHGVVFRLARPDEAAARLADFARLHEARFAYRGGSAVLDERVMRMLEHAAPQMMTHDRFRLHLVEHDGQVLSAEIVLAAGGEATSWLGGFDDRWAREQVSMQGLLAAVDYAMECNDTRLDFGPGAQSYKLRFCDREEQLDWCRLYPPGPLRPLAMAITLPRQLAERSWQGLLDAVPEERKHQVKRLLRQRGR